MVCVYVCVYNSRSVLGWAESQVDPLIPMPDYTINTRFHMSQLCQVYLYFCVNEIAIHRQNYPRNETEKIELPFSQLITIAKSFVFIGIFFILNWNGNGFIKTCCVTNTSLIFWQTNTQDDCVSTSRKKQCAVQFSTNWEFNRNQFSKKSHIFATEQRDETKKKKKIWEKGETIAYYVSFEHESLGK